MTDTDRPEILPERRRRAWWWFPVLIALLIFGTLVFLSSSAVSPFVYAFF